MSTKLYPYQNEGVQQIERFDGRALLADEMGLGKSVAINTPILTPDGWVSIGQLKVGDRVVGGDGKFCNVIGVYPQGKKQIYRIWFKDGIYTDCDKNHLWQVNTATRNWRGNHHLVLTTGELIERGIYSKVGAWGLQSKWYIPIVKPIQFEKKELPIPPYAMGAMLGNGSFSRQVSFSSVDNEVVRRVKNDLIQWEMVSVGNAKDYRFNKGNNSESLFDVFVKLGLAYHHASSKFIPHDYLFSSIEDRIELLHGLMDTDGTVLKSGCKNGKGNTAQYCTVSQQLCADIIHLVRSLGGIATYRIRKKPKFTYRGEHKVGQDAYEINICLPFGICAFSLKRKADLCPNVTGKYPPSRAITKIEALDEESEMVCIAVDSPDNLYVAEHFVVTHNTIQAIKYIIDSDSYPAVVVCPASLKLNWQREFMTHFGKRAEVLSGGKSETLRKAGNRIYIINYDILSKWEKRIIELQPTIIVADECFVAGTPISTPTGDVPIEFISAGMVVYNGIGTGVVEVVSVREISVLVQIELNDGQIIKCTCNHLFFTVDAGWVTAAHLKSGNYLFTRQSASDLMADNNSSVSDIRGCLKVMSVTVLRLSESVPVYNLQVSGHPSYFAGGVLVHNCHMVKSLQANRTKVLLRLSEKVEHFVAISGTPMTNHVTELYPILRMVLGEDGIESRREFCDRYSKLELTRWGFRYVGSRRLPELHKRLQKTCMIRRLVKDVLPDLPDFTRQTIPIELPREARMEYVQMNAAFADWYYEKFPEKSQVQSAVIITKLGYMKRQVAYWKLPFVYDWIDEFFEESEDKKLVVFGLHHKVIDGIVNRYTKRGTLRKPFVVKVDGAISMNDRQRAVDLFQQRPETRLFVGQMRAAGVGLTLTASSNVLFAECDFVPAVHSQAEKRCIRISQKNHVLCTYIVAQNTIEEHVADILQRKQSEFNSAMDGGKSYDDFNLLQELMKRLRDEKLSRLQ
ncbi:MAG: hypothetical protein LBP87_07940 [Planctomycetaceae bacterium]|nr:hypothetical protein [Planctomycetaceae bacterium]